MAKEKIDRVITTSVQGIQPQSTQIEIPVGVNVMYTDMVNMTVNEFGVVFDFGQRVGPTNKVNIVSRIGMSREHAGALFHLLESELKKK